LNMKRWGKMISIADPNWLEIIAKSFRGFLCMGVAGFLLGLCQPLYGQGSLAETATTMELQEEINGGGARPTAPKPATRPKDSNGLPKPAPEANNIAEKQGIEKLEKVAQKLMQSIQSDRYDQADFSAVWNTIVPKDANFSDGINAMLKPVFDQFGKAEKLGQGKMAGANRAVFPVQFTRGTLNMTVSLDQQDKIVEWTLMPATQAPSGTAAGETSTEPAEAVPGPSKDANAPDISDFNSFQRELNRINIESRSEEEQWLGRLEKKVELARAIDELVAAQLRFVRKLAEVEHAEQTIKAVDLVLKQRQDRLNKLVTKLEEAKQERQQSAERRERKPTRAGGQGQNQPEQRPKPLQRTTPAEQQQY
jgi:hypothetical protein